MMLSDKEKKLLILAFDHAAEVGEALAAIRALARLRGFAAQKIIFVT